MTRPLCDLGPRYCSRSSLQRQQQQCPRNGQYPSCKKQSLGGSYTASMASMIGQHGPVGATGPLKKINGSHERRNSNSSHCPPVSDSHLIAVHLGEVYPPNTCKDSRGIFNGLVGAIERHILHSDPSGNVKIPSHLLHIGECPEVPEHLATFALRRSGSLHFRQPQDEAAELQEEKKTAAAQEQSFKQRGSLGHHSSSEPKFDTCNGAAQLARSENSTCCDLAALSQSSANSSGSSLTSSAETVRVGGLRRTFSWHRIRDKLRR